MEAVSVGFIDKLFASSSPNAIFTEVVIWSSFL
jgi:hypothetical protein